MSHIRNFGSSFDQSISKQLFALAKFSAEEKKTAVDLWHDVSFQKKLLKNQDFGIAEGTTICEKLAVLKQERSISHSSLTERLAKLATVRADLDFVRQEREEECRIIEKELAQRKADLDIKDAQLVARCEKLDVRCADLDKKNVMLILRFEELDKRKNELFNKETELVVRGKELSSREKEVLKGQEENARKHEALQQLIKSYSQPQPRPESQPPKDEPPEYFMDNVFTLDIMEEPVVATDGFTYENRCILEWFRTKRTSPTSGAVLTTTTLIPNHSLKSQINQWKEEQVRRS